MTMPQELSDVLPIQYCGLDPLFNASLKLYICDVLNIPELKSPSGAFRYRGHLVVTVDIMGIIVKKDIREKIIIYAVDDGTGVIGCSCWKIPSNESELQSVNYVPDAVSNQSLSTKILELQTLKQLSADGFAIGSLLHVRGNITTYNGVREIKALHAAVVDNPNVETERMLNQIELYRRYYDQPVSLPSMLVCEIEHGGKPLDKEMDLLRSLTEAILHVVEKNHFEEIHIDKLAAEQHLAQLASNSTNPKIWYHAMTDLEVKGHFCRYPSSNEEFMVVSNNKQLHEDVLNVIRDCSDNQGGASFHYIFAVLTKSLRYARMYKIALQHCLTTLEKLSDVTMVSDKCYVAIS